MSPTLACPSSTPSCGSRRPGTYQIIDLGSHNGTFVNGARVNQAELNDNDIIAIGHATFRLTGGELIEYVDDGRATFEAHELRVTVGDGGKQKVLLDSDHVPAGRAVHAGGHRPGRARASPPCSTR